MKAIQKEKSSKITQCRVCKSDRLHTIINLGKQPVANGLLDKFDDKVESFPLELCMCLNCETLQLADTVDKEYLFENYTYMSSFSQSFINHFKGFAKDLARNKPGLVIDIGSNDGILLKELQDLGIKALGIEPSPDMVQRATDKGCSSILGYIEDIDTDLLISEHGQADIITASNVFAHIDDIHGALENAKALLKENGHLIIEVAWFGNIFEKMYFDTIYHEHFFYWGVTTFSRFAHQHGMDVYFYEKIPTHGGSIRMYLKKGGLSSGFDIVDEERKIVDKIMRNPIEYSTKLLNLRARLKSVITKYQSEGCAIIGYGAPAKASTLINFYGLNYNDIDFIIDDAVTKQGKYIPGGQVKIIPYESLKEWTRKIVIIIFAWNYADDIIKKLKEDLYSNDVIIPLPEVKIVEI